MAHTGFELEARHAGLQERLLGMPFMKARLPSKANGLRRLARRFALIEPALPDSKGERCLRDLLSLRRVQALRPGMAFSYSAIFCRILP